MAPRWMRCNQCNIEVVSEISTCPNHVGHVMVPTGKPVETGDLPQKPKAAPPDLVEEIKTELDGPPPPSKPEEDEPAGESEGG